MLTFMQLVGIPAWKGHGCVMSRQTSEVHEEELSLNMNFEGFPTCTSRSQTELPQAADCLLRCQSCDHGLIPGGDLGWLVDWPLEATEAMEAGQRGENMGKLEIEVKLELCSSPEA